MMKTVTEIARQIERGMSDCRRVPESSQTSSAIFDQQQAINAMAMYLLNNAPDRQAEIAMRPEKCFTDDSLTLGELRGRYGEGAPQAWLVPQLTNLSEYCGVRDKLRDSVLRECAGVIATNWYYLKTSELMLFFHRFKCGKYGRFYGSVDPLIIADALNQFVFDRNIELDKIEQAEREARLNKSKGRCVSREEYLKNWKDKIEAEKAKIATKENV